MINNMPIGNEWHIQDKDDKSMNYRTKYKFCFEQFKAEKIRKLIKSYVWHNFQTSAITLSTIYSYFSYFKKFNLFASLNGIESLTRLDSNVVDNFMTYLRMLTSKLTGKPFHYSTQESTFKALRAIVYWGQIFTPELVPAREVFLDGGYSGCSMVHRIEYIPDSVLKQINSALLIEENPYVKYGIIIFLSTGMRLSELLNLEVGCVTPHLLNGDTLSRYDFKKRRWHRKIPINPVCAHAIVKLTEVTAETRNKAADHMKKFLFLYEPKVGIYAGQIRVLYRDTFTNWVNGYISSNIYKPGFMDRHNIIGSDSKVYKVKTHQFRKTVATDMFSKNVNLKVIQEFLGLTRSSTTMKCYADGKDIDRAVIFKKVGIIGNINKIDSSVIDDKNDLAWFMKNKDKGAKMCDGYCTLPIVEGKICERLINHQKCYTCSRYITTPEYLQAHKVHLAELESQVVNNIYGSHYAVHLEPTITILKDIIKRLEAAPYES